MRMLLRNSSDVAKKAYLYPGQLFKEINLYRIKNNLADPEALQEGNSGYVLISLNPHEEAEFLLSLRFSKTTHNSLNPKLVSEEFLPYFKLGTEDYLTARKAIGLVLSGVLIMMMLFTLVNFFVTGRIEFLYNFCYCACNFLLIFGTSFLSSNVGKVKVVFSSYYDMMLLVTGTIAYLAFTRKFLKTKTELPRLNLFLRIEEFILWVLSLAFTATYLFSDDFILQNWLETTMKWIMLIAGMIYIVVALIQKNKLMNYLAIGTFVQIAFSFISFIIILYNPRTDSFFTSPFFYFEMGVVVSVIFFLLGLTYKNKTELIEKIKDQEAMKLEVEKKNFETRLAVLNAQQAERNRISADMHDDLGAGMTTIRLYSELAKNKIKDHDIPEIGKISDSANDLLNKMNAIIWSMSSSNDSLGNMIAYIRSYALEYFEDTGIKCKIDIPERLPEMEVTGEIRRNIFLVVKEALHNVVKHANATEVNISLVKEPSGLSLTIHDNGIGIDHLNLRMFGNGLKNMRKRMDDIGVEFMIEKHEGTRIRLYRQTR